MKNFPLKSLHCKNYKNFDLARLFEKLQMRLTNLDMNNLDLGSLKICFKELLNKVAPLKSKFLRANHSKF